MKQKERLVFCTYPSFYSSLVLQKLLASPDIDVIAIISSTRNLRVKENALASSFARIIKSGLRYSAYLWMITSGHYIFSRWSRVLCVEALAKKNHIPNYQTNNINNSKMDEVIRGLKPDILLCTHFNQRIAPEVYALAEKSALNIHPSLLPDLKGVDPSFYALLNNYKTTGVSLHRLDEEFDAGAVVLNQPHEVKSTDSLFSLNCELFEAGGDLCLTYLNRGQSRQQNNLTETKEKTHYTSWPSASDVNIFKKHRKLLSMQDIKWIFSKPSL